MTSATLRDATESDLPSINDIYNYPLRSAAVEALTRQLRSGISDEELARLVMSLREENRLCIVIDEETVEPQIICSLGLRSPEEPP
jgi:L-amino acid N-acyltransferase YncA